MTVRLWLVLVFLLLTGCSSAPVLPTHQRIIDQFVAAGLIADAPRPMERADYGLAPFVCNGQRFTVAIADGDEQGGRLFVCDNDADRDRLRAYYDELGKASAALYSYTSAKGPVLLQLNGAIPEATAQRYGDVIAALP